MRTLLLFILCLLVPCISLKKITELQDNDSEIEIHEKGIHYFSINFTANSGYSTYYIATQEKENKKDKEDIKLFLGGDCIESCSNLVSEPDSEHNCGEQKEFVEEYYLIKLIPNKACNLYFSIETKIHLNLLLHYQQTIQIQDIQTIPIHFKIPKAPVFFEYIPKFPANFVSLAKIYVDLAEKNIHAVYFGKDSDYETCNTPYPDYENHCFSFQLPSYEEPRSYFVAFDYIAVLTSNLYIAIYPKKDVTQTKVTIGYNMPFLVEGVLCPPENYLAIRNSDIYCSNCSQHCKLCNETQCLKCEKHHALLNNLCHKHDCDSFKEYKNKKGHCVECEDHCEFCLDEKTCLECKTDYVRLKDEKCELKEQCKESQYYNSTRNKCGNCSEGCETCENSTICQKCKETEYFLESQNFTCVEYPKCLLNQFLIENNTKCENCSEKCENCVNKTHCLNCSQDYEVKNGTCIPNCGNNKFYNFEVEKCEDCVGHCKICNNNKTCEICKGGFYKTEETLCQESPLCKPNQYISKIGDTCLDCPSNCTSCRNTTFCQTCKQGFSIVGHQVCAPSCEKYKFYNITGQKCDSCIDKCESCLDEATCQKCRGGFSFNFVEGNGSCIYVLFASLKSSLVVLLGVVFILASNTLI